MNSYESLKEALDDLRYKGYNRHFGLEYTGIYCGLLDILLTPEEFNVDEVHRFQDEFYPDDESVLYVISSNDDTIKGTLVDAFGVYAESMSFDMAAKFQVQNRL